MVAAVAVPLAWQARRNRRLRRGLIGEVAEGVIEDVTEQRSYHLFPVDPGFVWLHCRYQVPGKGTYRRRFPFTGPGHETVDAIGRRIKVRYLPSSPYISALAALEASDSDSAGLG